MLLNNRTIFRIKPAPARAQNPIAPPVEEVVAAAPYSLTGRTGEPSSTAPPIDVEATTNRTPGIDTWFNAEETCNYEDIRCKPLAELKVKPSFRGQIWLLLCLFFARSPGAAPSSKAATGHQGPRDSSTPCGCKPSPPQCRFQNRRRPDTHPLRWHRTASNHTTVIAC